MEQPSQRPSGTQSPALRALLVLAGSLCVALGVLGLFLPLLPTTPFLLLAAACYLRSSERMYRWLHTNRLFGEFLRRYRKGEGIPWMSKLLSITLLWLTLGLSAFLAVPDTLGWLRILLFLVGAGVTIHLLCIPTSSRGGT